MTSVLASRARKSLVALVAAATVGGALAPTEANAGHRGGYAVGAFAGGLLLGAMIAQPQRPVYYRTYRRTYYRSYRNCWTERRRSYDAYGYVYVRRVRVCG